MKLNRFKISIICIALAIFLIAGGIIFGVVNAKRQEDKKSEANDWFLAQTDYLNNVLNFLDSVDTVYCLYLSGSMSKTDFISYNNLLTQQYDIMNNEYEIYKKNNPVKAGTQSFISQSGINAIENIRLEIKKMLSDMIVNGEPLEYYNMIYTYLAHNENLNDYFCEFTVCFRWLIETDDFEQDYSTLVNAWNRRINELKERKQ